MITDWNAEFFRPYNFQFVSALPWNHKRSNMQLQIIAILHRRKRKFGIYTHLIIIAIKPYYPDWFLLKINIDNKNTALKKYRLFTVMTFFLRNRKENLSIRIMNQTKLSSLYCMTFTKNLFRFIKVTVFIIQSIIPLTRGSLNRLNICNSISLYRFQMFSSQILFPQSHFFAVLNLL